MFSTSDISITSLIESAQQASNQYWLNAQLSYGFLGVGDSHLKSAWKDSLFFYVVKE